MLIKPMVLPEYLAYLDTDCGRFRVSAEIKLILPEVTVDQDETEFRARQLLNLFKASMEDETRRINFLHTMTQRNEINKHYAIAAGSHAHCECRSTNCGHLDIRHTGPDGECTYEGCKCKGWS